MSRRRSLARDARGTSAIELAFVAPLIILLILAVVDFSLAFAEKLDLEQAAARTVERATSAGLMGSNYDYLKPEAVAASGEPLAHVTLDQWLECDGTRKASFSDSCTTGQQIARYVSIAITGEYEPLFNYSYFAALYGGTSRSKANIPISGDAVVRVQ